MRASVGTIGVALAIIAGIGGAKSFVGPADDPFFVDLGAVFDGISIDKPARPQIATGNQDGGRDDVSGFNTAVATPDLKNFGAPALSPEPARLDVSGDWFGDHDSGDQLDGDSIAAPRTDKALASISIGTWMSLGTRNGGEVVSGPIDSMHPLSLARRSTRPAGERAQSA